MEISLLIFYEKRQSLHITSQWYTSESVTTTCKLESLESVGNG